jgi:hypothetical protein
MLYLIGEFHVVNLWKKHHAFEVNLLSLPNAGILAASSSP